MDGIEGSIGGWRKGCGGAIVYRKLFSTLGEYFVAILVV